MNGKDGSTAEPAATRQNSHSFRKRDAMIAGALRRQLSRCTDDNSHDAGFFALKNAWNWLRASLA